jgi:glycosyltransferase involved in cell wall biosynthesis
MEYPNPKISILMPIYNGIEFIETSLNSIKRQTYPHWECIVGINGHSISSETYAIAKSYETENIKVFHLTTVGKAASLNEMVKLASYEWIALLDVDDEWYDEKLELQTKLFCKYDVIGTCAQYFGTNFSVPEIPFGHISGYNFLLKNPIINSSVVLKKKLCYWNELLDGVEDYDLWLQLWIKKYLFYNIPEILTRHRLHGKSAFNTKNFFDVELSLKKKYASKLIKSGKITKRDLKKQNLYLYL